MSGPIDGYHHADCDCDICCPEPAPSAGSERCPRCASSDRNGECFAPTGAKDTPRHPWHFPPESGKESDGSRSGTGGLAEEGIGALPVQRAGVGSTPTHPTSSESGKEGETNANISDCSNNSLHSDRSADGRVDNRQPLTPSPAQGAEEWRKSHTRFSSVERQYYWNDVTVDAYAAHVTATKGKEIEDAQFALINCVKPYRDEVERLKRALVECRNNRFEGDKISLIVGAALSPETDGGRK